MAHKEHKPYKIFFETLSNQARWDIVHLLQAGEYRVGDIAEKLGYERSLVSHNLARLEKCGFIKVKQNGRERMYSINSKEINKILQLVDEHINKYCAKQCVQYCCK